MDQMTPEQYFIARAKAMEDPYASRAMMLTAKTIFPQDFRTQFEAYQCEKKYGNYDEAAKNLSNLLVTFQNQHPPELWQEVAKLTAALRMPEEKSNEGEDGFYIKMFQHISYEVQHSILILTASNSENHIDHCRLILLLLKRFPQTVSTHAPRLIETLLQGMKTNLIQNRDILIQEALPLILAKPIELPVPLINRILFVTFEYYVNRILMNAEEKDQNWAKVFEIMEAFTQQLKWEHFLPYKAVANKDTYWQRLFQIVSSSPPKPSENKQIVYYATILFIMSLQEYVENVQRRKTGDTETEFLLMEGLREGIEKRRKHESNIDSPRPLISAAAGCPSEVASCFVVAITCWQLVHSNEILQHDFQQLIGNLTTLLKKSINRFLLDLAVYFGRNDEALSLMKDETSHMTPLEKSLRLLSLTLQLGTQLNIQAFDHINSIVQELPTKIDGQYIANATLIHAKRQLILLPLTRKAVLQYCVKAIVVNLKHRMLTDPNCSNQLMGNLLVLTQLDWPNEISIVEMIFERIRMKRAFSYLLFPNYIINIDMIEEFMNLWHPGDIKLEFSLPHQSSSRRIGTRGSDKGVKEDFKQIIKQQVSRSNEDIDALIIQFLQLEQTILLQNVLEK